MSVEESNAQVRVPERKRIPVQTGAGMAIMDYWSEAIGASGFHFGSVSKILPSAGILCSAVNLAVRVPVSATSVELDERLIAAQDTLVKRYITVQSAGNGSHEDVRRLHVERVAVGVARREHEGARHGGARRGREPEHVPLEEALKLGARDRALNQLTRGLARDRNASHDFLNG